MEKRQTWGSRSTFIFAAIGSAVGLGNAWRFPGLAAKYGGGAFLLVYVFALLLIGIPLLTMEISLGRKTKQGAPGAMRAVNKKTEFVGWASTSNCFIISTYYSVVFAWVLMMVAYSFKFAHFTGEIDGADKAKNLFGTLIQNKNLGWNGGSLSPVWIVLLFLLIAWVLIYLCIRKGTVSAGKVVKYTGIFLPLGFLIILAIRGFTLPNGLNGLYKLFIPDFNFVIEKGLLASMFIDAIGQVFFSLSIMMAVMFAYGSYVKDDANIAEDALIIAVSDLLISILSGIVMFTTMYGVGMKATDMSDSGIATAFRIYPTAIVQLTHIGWLNAIFGAVFYLCLCSLAIDSAFSMVEGVSTAVSDKFKLNPHKTTIGVCVVAGIISLLYITKGGIAWLDIVDNWTNQYNIILVGVLECVAVGWLFDPNKVLKEANKNTKRYKMPKWWFDLSIKFIAPLALLLFCGWNIYSLFSDDGIYGNYPFWSNVVGGWMVTILAFASGFIIKLIVNAKKKNGFKEDDFVWKDDE